MVHFERFAQPGRLCGYAVKAFVKGLKLTGSPLNLAVGEATPENKTDSGIAERIRVFEGEGLEPGGGVWNPWMGLDRTRRRPGC